MSDDWGLPKPPWPMYFNRQGQPITMEEWGALRWTDDLERNDYSRVGLDTYPALEDLVDPLETRAVVTVSTVWLGINHSWGRGIPIIFETMIFGGDYDGELTRYATEAAAAEGHQQTIDDIRAGAVPWFLREAMADD